MIDALTYNTKHLIGALVAGGVKYFVLSPGSRSTPVALLIAEYVKYHPNVKLYVDVDERSAGFFALGIAKATLSPVVLLGTSGTAITEYTPAVAEASVSEVPLIILSTDRPQELQYNGAPQTLPQQNIFGKLTKADLAFNLQETHQDITEYIDFATQKFVHLANTAPCGPVQFNLPLRKPLMPTLGNQDNVLVKQLSFSKPSQIKIEIPPIIAKRVLILAGPNVAESYSDDLLAFSQRYHVPVIADILSRVRTPETIHGIDYLLKFAQVTDELKPDLVIRFGKTPVSAKVLQWLKHANIETWHVDLNAGTDHSRHVSRAILMQPRDFLRQAKVVLSEEQQAFETNWQLINQKDKRLVHEMAIVSALDRAVSPKTAIFVANSMPIRDMDDFFTGINTQTIYANRGANGIDGVISTALGMGATTKQRSLLLTGDLTLFHDMNGLMMARNYQLPLDIIVIDNNGGGIFSFLPQAEATEYFETLFGTPLALDISKIASLYQLSYVLLKQPEDLQKVLNQPTDGTRIIVYPSDRAQNVRDHQKYIGESL